MSQSAPLLQHMESVIIGKRETLRFVLGALVAGGHVLIEDVPGVAKTLIARTLARTFALDFKRVQMTPDLLPADLTGAGVWDEQRREFVFQPGPIFAQILLADELNRATPRTQAGLLEAMEERAVSAEGRHFPLPEPFFVVATQNPVEQQGVFPLPEAQVDRFMIQISVGYPSQQDEFAIVQAQTSRHPIEGLQPIATLDDLRAMRAAVEGIHTDASIYDYLVRLVRASRERDDVMLGASPRASLALHHLARALAWLDGESFIRPDHVQQAAKPVLRHRLVLTPQARLAGVGSDEVIDQLLANVTAPIYKG